MKYNLREVRESYGMTIPEFAKIAGISEYCYRQYENDEEVPCKYIFALWKELNTEERKFPLPEDFFYYTSATLLINMKFYRIKETEAAKQFGVRQSTLSSFVAKEPMPMYELKEKFHETFSKLIIPYEYDRDAEEPEPKIYTDLTKRGNFVSSRRKKEYREFREMNGLTTDEHKRLRREETKSKMQLA